MRFAATPLPNPGRDQVEGAAVLIGREFPTAYSPLHRRFRRIPLDQKAGTFFRSTKNQRGCKKSPVQGRQSIATRQKIAGLVIFLARVSFLGSDSVINLFLRMVKLPNITFRAGFPALLFI
ncbi:MAG: hypothetical protein II184_09360 [Clostridia bacterium]|nr:hypothetical protein [Clostridia bacterium]